MVILKKSCRLKNIQQVNFLSILKKTIKKPLSNANFMKKIIILLILTLCINHPISAGTASNRQAGATKLTLKNYSNIKEHVFYDACDILKKLEEKELLLQQRKGFSILLNKQRKKIFSYKNYYHMSLVMAM